MQDAAYFEFICQTGHCSLAQHVATEPAPVPEPSVKPLPIRDREIMNWTPGL